MDLLQEDFAADPHVMAQLTIRSSIHVKGQEVYTLNQGKMMLEANR